MWLFHGWIFMVYVVVAFLLLAAGRLVVRRSPCVVLAAGLIPLLIFWVERVVHQQAHAPRTPTSWSPPASTAR